MTTSAARMKMGKPILRALQRLNGNSSKVLSSCRVGFCCQGALQQPMYPFMDEKFSNVTRWFGSSSSSSSSTKSSSSLLMKQPIRFSTVTVMDDDEYDYDDRETTGTDHPAAKDINITVETRNFGNIIEISNLSTKQIHGDYDDDDDDGNTNVSFFHASWLWINDPSYIHATSGQKLRSLGEYQGSTIVSAKIVHVRNDVVNEANDGDQDDNVVVNFPISPPGCWHSRGGVYQQRLYEDHNIMYESDDDKNNGVDRRGQQFDQPHVSRPMLIISWDDGDESKYDLDWLRRHGNDVGSVTTAGSENGKRTLSPTQITKEMAIGAIGNPNTNDIPKLEYESVMENETVLFEAMQHIFHHGAILIQNVPSSRQALSSISSSGGYDDDVDDENSNLTDEQLEVAVAELGKHLSGGTLSHGTLYGDVFHVKSMTNAHNIAYTSMGLPPHQDLTYYESKPFLQLLHCVHGTEKKGVSNSNRHNENIVHGGESVLLDAIAAAEELRWIAPNYFDVLCRTEATFLKQREGADLVSFKPHIVTSPVTGEVVAVHWSPPFEGPLQLSSPSSRLGSQFGINSHNHHHHHDDAYNEYLLAYQALECMFDNNSSSSSAKGGLLHPTLREQLKEYSNKYTWEYALRHGEILIFNNQRMLHGRRSFSVKEGNQRHLVGCYTDAMDTISRYRVLMRNNFSNPSTVNPWSTPNIVIPNAGNGTRGTIFH